MTSVTEQLQKYRALNARKNAALLKNHPQAIICKHPKTSDYFQALMQRWQSVSSDGSLTPAHSE